MENVLKQPAFKFKFFDEEINSLIKSIKKPEEDQIKQRKRGDFIDIYERSTAPSESNTETAQYNPTKELIQFLIKRNREDATRLKLTHFKNIRCKDNNNKSCIVPIYKAPEKREDQHTAENSNLLIHTINYKYMIFIQDIYNITYKDLLERMDARYKIKVGIFKE